DDGLWKEGEDDHAEHQRDKGLANAVAGVNVVANVSLLGAAVADGEVLLLAVRHTNPGPISQHLTAGLSLPARLGAVVGDQRARSSGLLFFSSGSCFSLAGGALKLLRGSLVGSARRFSHGSSLRRCRLKITSMTDLELPSAAKSQPHSSLNALRDAVQAGLPSAIADLSRLIRIPSVSWDGFDPAHVAASAVQVKALFDGLGVFETVEIAQAPIAETSTLGQPAVLATRAARNGKPTIMLYAHHDVQPPGKDEDWDTPPFEPTLRGDRLYGRGAADDKAGVLAHVAAIRAFVETVGTDFDLGLVVFIEGEEEFGSRSFSNFLTEHHEQLTADVIVVADSDNWDINTPSLTVALRGNVTFKLTVATLGHASHSGMFGGAAPDSMMATVTLLASLYAPDGSVAVAGLQSRESDTPEYSEERLREEAALLPGVTPIGRGPILSRLWMQPAITITGIDAPTVANASNTLSASTSVRISARIAPGQTGEDAFAALEKHLVENAPYGANITITGVDTGNPFLVDTSGWAVAEAKAAMEDAWGVPAVETGIGGSIPFISDLVAQFPAAQILVTGVEDPDTRAHSPNESLHLGVFRRAILTEAVLLAKLESRA
ncbi:MAG: dipeptidase, partial [Glaciihabitans sp.]|nr:dipeptidase [Glaciihabitans sp.]